MQSHPASARPTLAEVSGDVLSVIGHAEDSGEDIAAAMKISVALGEQLPAPGGGQTLQRWAGLAALGRVNLTAARMAEAHTDALAILAEAGVPRPANSWGVFAAEAPGHVLTADATDGEILLTGVKPWCSLADVLDRALVTAHVPGGRRLFEIDLGHPGVEVEPARAWVARGLRTVTSVPITCDRVPGRPIGDVDWYLTRDGFAWGGIGVAACWFGGAVGLADALDKTARRRERTLDSLHVGTVDLALHAAAAVLTGAAARIDAGEANGARGEILALQVRGVVADTVETVLRAVGHALGPAPLAFDAGYAANVADLELYVRQHHGERDVATLGDKLLSEPQ